MSAFEAQEKIASEVLEKKGTLIVRKVTRTGATITPVLVALRQGKKVTLIVPTKNLAREAIKQISNLLQIPFRVAYFGPNSEICKKLDANLKIRFQFREKCSECDLEQKTDECAFQRLLVNDFDLYVLTYDKLQALQLSQSAKAKVLLDKLINCDVFIFDEFTTALLTDAPTLELISADQNGRIVNTLKSRLDFGGYNLNKWADVLKAFLALFEAKNNGVYENTAWNYTLLLDDKLRQELFFNGWNEIAELTSEKNDTTELQDIFRMTFAKRIIVNRDGTSVMVTSTVDDALQYLKSFVTMIGNEKTVFVIDSYQPRSVDFQSIFGNVTNVLWGEKGDPLNTNSKQLIIADTAHWGAWNFLLDSKLEAKAKQHIAFMIEQFGPERILIVTTNKAIANTIYRWCLPKGVKVTWFRSDLMRGVQAEERNVMICVGGPYLPKKAYVSQSESFDFEDFLSDLGEMNTKEEKTLQLARFLRADDTCSEFTNAIGRVKDPRGNERSIVVTLGMQLSEVHSMLKQSSSFEITKPKITQSFFGGGLLSEVPIMAKLWMTTDIQSTLDLSVLARIIDCVNQKKLVSSSQVIIGRTNLVKDVALKHKHILGKYGIKVVLKQGGMSFEKA